MFERQNITESELLGSDDDTNNFFIWFKTKSKLTHPLEQELSNF